MKIIVKEEIDIKLIEDEAKKVHENYIINHLMELNIDNDTVAIQVDYRNAYVSFLKKNGKIILAKYPRMTYEQNLANRKYCLCEYMTPNGSFFLHLDTQNPFVVKDVKEK